MSLKFNDAIELVAEKLLEAPKPNYEAYLQDAAEISEKFDLELIMINSIFRGRVSNWNETAEFFNTEIPKLQDPVLRLKFPFMVEPQRVFVFSSDEIHPVNLKTSVIHPAAENGYLNGEKLTKLFIWDMNRVIERISKVTCRSGKIYKFCSEIAEHPAGGLFINIMAKENEQPSISYNFVLQFLFPNKPFGYTYASNFFHESEQSTAAARLKIRAKVVQSVQILLQNLVNVPMLSLYQMNLFPLYIESMTVGSALLEAIPKCIQHLQNPGPLISAYGKLLQFKQSDSVQLTELMTVFGLK